MSNKKQQQATSGLWSPETVGQATEGKFVGLSAGSKKYKTPILQLTGKSGGIGIPCSVVVARALQPIVESLTGKDTLKFVFLGHPANAKGNAAKTKLFEIYLNGNMISNTDFPVLSVTEAKKMLDAVLEK